METKQRTYIVLEVTHVKDIPHLCDMVAGRAWTIDGVRGVEVVKSGSNAELSMQGFTAAEIALGSGEVHRS